MADVFVESMVIKPTKNFSHTVLGNFIIGKIYEVPKTYGDVICANGLAEGYIVTNVPTTKILSDSKELLPDTLQEYILQVKDISQYFDS